MKTINLKDKRAELQKLGIEIFDHITGLSKEIRPDAQPRTGIQILMRDPDPLVDNLINFRVYEPSDRAQYFVCEKSMRTELLGDATSQNSENEKMKKFRGCVTLVVPDTEIILHCSTSGLFGSEDATSGIIMLSRAADVTIDYVISDILRRGGMLPNELSQKDHYLVSLLNRYK
jgi:hypothetical protein